MAHVGALSENTMILYCIIGVGCALYIYLLFWGVHMYIEIPRPLSNDDHDEKDAHP